MNATVRGVMRKRGLWVLAVVLISGLSCRHIPDQKEAESRPQAELLAEGELSVFMTRLGPNPVRKVTSAERLPVSLYFDPELVDVKEVTKYSLWCLEEPAGSWKRIRTASPQELPLEMELDEGLIGLRASATYADGSEKFVPAVGDKPALRVCVDRTAPSLVWVSPREQSSVHGVRQLELKWATNEIQFGDYPAKLEWSDNDGRTWKRIGTTLPRLGHQTYTWKVPREVSSDVLVRVSSRDMVGNESTASLPLSYPENLGSRGSVLATAAQVSEGADTFVLEDPSPPATSAPQPTPQRNPQRAVVASTAAATTASTTASTTSPAVVASSLATSAPPPVAATAAGPTTFTVDTPAETRPALDSLAESGGYDSGRLSSAPLSLDGFDATVLQGGKAVPVCWTFDGSPPDVSVRVEWSPDGGMSWIPVGKGPLADGSLEWKLPQESFAGCFLRVLTVLPDGTRVEARSPFPFTIDAEPPRIALGESPELAGIRLSLPAAISDPGGAGTANVEVYLRRAGADEWRRLDGDEARFDGSNIHLDLASEKQGSVELFVRAMDRVANASPLPPREGSPEGDLTGRMTRFLIDRSPPALSARATQQWVAGFPAEIEVQADWTEAVPQLLLEAQGSDGNWRESGRWSTVSPEQKRFTFIVPVGVEAYSVRVIVADALDNRAIATVGPHPVELPMRLVSFTEKKAYPALGTEKIRWQLHAIASEFRDELKVSLFHQAGSDGKWARLHQKIPADSDYYWDMPAGDDVEHRIRVSLLRLEKIVGEAVSAPFTIAGPSAPTIVGIKDDSRFYSEQARSQVETYVAGMGANPPASPAELKKLSAGITASFAKALEIDRNNYHATYGLAQFLHRTDPEKNRAAVSRLLYRTVDIKPDHFWALNDLGAMHIRQREFAKAEEVLRKCAALTPSAIVHYNLGLSLFYEGKLEEAKDQLEAALRADDKDTVPEGEVYYYLVYAYLKEGNTERARGLFLEKESLMSVELREEIKKVLHG